ncbi:MAG: hypothetical protein U0800_23510 [Isosphaeraceae bacterium]
MSTDPRLPADGPGDVPPVAKAPAPTARKKTLDEHHHCVRIFTFPKIIFLWPTFVAALVCGIGMTIYNNNTLDPKKQPAEVVVKAPAKSAAPTPESPAGAIPPAPAQSGAANEPTAAVEGDDVIVRIPRRFNSPSNLMALFFLGVFAFNIIVLALDFPRFTLVAGVFLAVAAVCALGWLSAAFNLSIFEPIIRALDGIFVAANNMFYFMIAIIIGIGFVVIWVTRWLDYWEIRPNEILHHHGPLSDLERFPTMNLKFDKEIPDVLEYLILGAGRLVMHVPSENRAFVLESVLWIDDKERRLKSMMSRMEVRVTTDREAEQDV